MVSRLAPDFAIASKLPSSFSTALDIRATESASVIEPLADWAALKALTGMPLGTIRSVYQFGFFEYIPIPGGGPAVDAFPFVVVPAAPGVDIGIWINRAASAISSYVNKLGDAKLSEDAIPLILKYRYSQKQSVDTTSTTSLFLGYSVPSIEAGKDDLVNIHCHLRMEVTSGVIRITDNFAGSSTKIYGDETFSSLAQANYSYTTAHQVPAAAGWTFGVTIQNVGGGGSFTLRAGSHIFAEVFQK